MLYKHAERLVHGATFEQSIPPAALLCVRWCLQTPRGRSVGAVRFSPSPIGSVMFAVSELSYWTACTVGVVDVSSWAPAATDNVAGKAVPSTAASVAAIFLATILSLTCFFQRRAGEQS